MPQQPVERPTQLQVLSIQGGQNDRDAVWMLGETNSALVQNLDIRSAGQRKRSNGVASLGGRSDAPYGLWRAYDNTLAQETLFTVYAGSIYAVPGGGVINQRGCGMSLTTALHHTAEGRWSGRIATYVANAQVNDSNNTLCSKLTVLTDSNLYSQTASMAPRAIAWFQNRLWCLDNSLSGDSETLWWSSLADGLLYSTTNSTQIEPGVGGRGTALQPIRGSNPALIVYKESAVFTLQPAWGASSSLIPAAADALDTIKTQVRMITNRTGCVAAKSVQFIPGAPGGDIYFWSKEGLRALTRANDDTISGATTPLSDPILTTVKRINYTYAAKMVSWVYDQKYHIAVPLDGATENSHVLVFDLMTGGWSVRTWAPKDMLVTRMGNTKDDLFLQYNTTTADCSNTGLFTAYHVFRTDTGRLDPGGAPVVYQEDSRGFHFGDLTMKKTWDSVIVDVLNNAATTCVLGLMYNVDGRGWITVGSLAFGGLPDDPVLGTTPLPWNATTGVFRQFEVSLADAQPGYYLQIRYLGTSELSSPVVLNISPQARPLINDYGV